MTRLPQSTPWGGHRWCVAETSSTMDEARALEAGGAPSGTVVRADHQIAGVGRFSSRKWSSAPGESLLFTGFWSFSLLARPEFAPSLTLGLGVCRWVEGLVGPGARVALKWPNDVYLNDRKLGGILVRTRLGPSGPPTLHAGIGLNLAQQVFEGEYRTLPISLAQAGVALQAEDALDGLLPALAEAMTEALPRSACEQRLWRRHKRVSLTLPGENEPRFGVILGLGEQGQLRWNTASGEELVSAGE